MDRVQFNTEVVNIRRTVRRVKILTVHYLIRQVAMLDKKKGSELQVSKNKRRSSRYLGELEALKDLTTYAITMKATMSKQTLKAVLKNPKSSATDRVLARLIHHKLIEERASKFKDMFTLDFLRMGNKKYRQQSKRRLLARTKGLNEYQDSMENIIKGPGGGVASSETGSVQQEAEDESKMEVRNWTGSEECSPEDSTLDVCQGGTSRLKARQNPSQSDERRTDSDDAASTSSDDDKDNDPIGEPHPKLPVAGKRFFDDLANHEANEKKRDVSGNRSETYWAGSRKQEISSMFMGSLTDTLDDGGGDATSRIPAGFKDRTIISKQQETPSEQKTLKRRQTMDNSCIQKPSSVPRQPAAHVQKPARKLQRRVASVDKPNQFTVQPTEEKQIPGINCHPQLPFKTRSRRDKPHGVNAKRPQRKFPLAVKGTGSIQSRMSAVAEGRPIPEPKVVVEKPATLHPSWEASRKRKLQDKIVPFLGKKITFGDD